METASTEVTSIRRRNNVEKSTWKTHRYFVDFESRIHVEISMSNRCHNFHVHSPFKIDVISTNFPLGIATSNRWRIDEDVSIGIFHFTDRLFECQTSHYKQILENYRETGKTRLRRRIVFRITYGQNLCRTHQSYKGSSIIQVTDIISKLEKLENVCPEYFSPNSECALSIDSIGR